MVKRAVSPTSGARVARHRVGAAARGMARVEVSVPTDDAAFVKALAGTLRRGGSAAAALRETLASAVPPPRAQTGAELVAFLRSSPLRDGGFVAERDRSPGRPIDLE